MTTARAPHNPPPPDPSAGDPAPTVGGPGPRRGVRRVVVAVAAGGLVLGCGVAYAAADGGGPAAPSASASGTAPSPSTSGTAPKVVPGPPGRAGRPAPRPHIDGTVASVQGGRITVTDRDGFTRIIVTTTATTYSGGLSADLAKGVEIHAVGTVDADHTSLDATSIGRAPAGPGRAGGPHGPRPGPPGAPKPPVGKPGRATPPTGKPTPPRPRPTGSPAPSAPRTGS